MQEHPVPQNVTGYEFHLIGQMTLKQFFTAGAGVLFAVITNATNLPEIFKYPMMVLFGLGGFALAFVPYEGRSLDRWFFAFITSIYKPTLFFWKKTNPVPELFTYTQPRYVDTTPQINYSGIRTRRAQEFLSTIPSKPADIVDKNEDTSAIMALFAQPLTPPAPPTPPAIPATPPTPPPQLTIPVYQHSVSEVTIKSTNNTVTVDKHTLPPAPPTPTPPQAAPQAVEIRTQVSPSSEITKPVATSSDLPFPKPPTKPNMIVGMVLSRDKKILSDAIVEIIRRADNVPVRALKTNLLGQFAIVTPLDSGEYEINIEKDGHVFDKSLLVLNNEVVAPLLLQAK